MSCNVNRGHSWSFNSEFLGSCGARGILCRIYGQNLLSTSVRRTIYQTKPLGMREPKKMVVMIFDAIKSARLRFFLIYQGPNHSILPFSQS